MMDFMLVAAGVFVGTLAATGVLLVLACNKKLIKAYTKYMAKIGVEIGEEVAEELMSKEDTGL